MNAITRFLLDARDFFQYAFGDREAVIKRFRERNQRAWEKIYAPSKPPPDATTLDAICNPLPTPKRRLSVEEMKQVMHDSAIDEGRSSR